MLRSISSRAERVARRCAHPVCQNEFVPRVHFQVYCSAYHRDDAYRRRAGIRAAMPKYLRRPDQWGRTTADD